MPDDTGQTIQARVRRPTMIKGLIPTLPERGKIKIGVKGAVKTSSRGNEFQPPQKLDHFVVTTLQRGNDGNFIPDETLMRRLGEKPTEIPVRLLYDDPTLNFPTRYACFSGRTLWCAGDGETATRATPAGPQEVPCTCERADPAYKGNDKCKMNGSLSVLIEGAGGIGGVWKFRTTSYNSIVGIMSTMAFIRSMTGGVLANIPLKLKVQPKQATAPDGNPVTIYFVSLEFDGDMPGLQEIAHGIALGRAKMNVSIEHIEEEAKRMLALAPPANVPLAGDDADDVVEEFYPEQALAEPEPPRGRDIAPESVATTKPAEIIDAETGEVLDRDAIERTARTAAEQGDAALRAYCLNLSKDEFKTIAHLFGTGDGELPRIARAADARREQPHSPAGATNGNGADNPQNSGKGTHGGRREGGMHADLLQSTPAGDDMQDMLGGAARKPAGYYTIKREGDTSADWNAWEKAIVAEIEAGDPKDAILRDNKGDLAIFEQIDEMRHNALMRALGGGRG